MRIRLLGVGVKMGIVDGGHAQSDDVIRCPETFADHEYIDPERRHNTKAFVSEKSKELPPGKTGFDVWGDLLGKLSIAAKQAAREEWAITWIPELEQRQKVRYIVTIPVAWQKGLSHVLPTSLVDLI